MPVDKTKCSSGVALLNNRNSLITDFEYLCCGEGFMLLFPNIFTIFVIQTTKSNIYVLQLHYKTSSGLW